MSTERPTGGPLDVIGGHLGLHCAYSRRWEANSTWLTMFVGKLLALLGCVICVVDHISPTNQDIIYLGRVIHVFLSTSVIFPSMILID